MQMSSPRAAALAFVVAVMAAPSLRAEAPPLADVVKKVDAAKAGDGLRNHALGGAPLSDVARHR